MPSLRRFASKFHVCALLYCASSLTQHLNYYNSRQSAMVGKLVALGLALAPAMVAALLVVALALAARLLALRCEAAHDLAPRGLLKAAGFLKDGQMSLMRALPEGPLGFFLDSLRSLLRLFFILSLSSLSGDVLFSFSSLSLSLSLLLSLAALSMAFWQAIALASYLSHAVSSSRRSRPILLWICVSSGCFHSPAVLPLELDLRCRFFSSFNTVKLALSLVIGCGGGGPALSIASVEIASSSLRTAIKLNARLQLSHLSR